MKQLFILLILLQCIVLSGQSINTTFGKNRVQYHDDFDSWKKYETENFVVHWYGKAQRVAALAVQMVEREHQEISQYISHRINDKIEILVYLDVTDVKQTNVGLQEEFYIQNSNPKVVDNKIFVYYDGTYTNLRHQIRSGIAKVYVEEMLLGANLKEMVRNAVQEDIASWFTEGFIAYAGRSWDHLLDDELRDLWFRHPKRTRRFDRLVDDYPSLGGHSMWYFLDQKYGPEVISNLIYLTRLFQDEEEAFLYALDKRVQDVACEWRDFYSDQFENDTLSPAHTPIKLKRNDYVPVSTIKISPKGSLLAYSKNNKGRVDIYVNDGSIDKKVFSFGNENTLQITDYGYPQMCWSMDGDALSIFYEKNDEVFLQYIDFEKDERWNQLIPEGIYRIYSCDHIDEDNYALSASLDGVSDIVIYETSGRSYKRITDDYYDDLDVSVGSLAGRKGVFFSSNRDNNTTERTKIDSVYIPEDYNLFFYDLEADDGSLFRITDTPESSERYPVATKDGRVLFLSNTNGIKNLHTYSLLANNNERIGTAPRNLIRYGYDEEKNEVVYTYYYNGKYMVYRSAVGDLNAADYETHYFGSQDTQAEEISEVVTEEKLKDGYKFVSPFEDPEDLQDIFARNNDNVSNDLDQRGKVMEITDIVPSRTEFKVFNITSRFDNSDLFEGLQSYTGEQNQVLNNSFGLLMQGEYKDLLENYIVTIGMRIPITIDGTEFFATLDDRKNRLDKKYAVYRKYKKTSPFLDGDFRDDFTITWLGLVRFNYPFDVYRSFRFTPSLRFDTYRTFSQSNETFRLPSTTEERISLKAEYIYDSSTPYRFNILHGLRYKVYAEAINEFNIGLIDEKKFELSKGFTGVLGFDGRYYHPLLKHSVLAVRTSGATSIGNKKNLYYLGDVNNNIVSAFNSVIPVSTDQAFAYKTNVHHLRGFASNIRNGTSYLLFNAELRVPLFQYLRYKPRAFRWLDNIQLVGFGDAGSAWYGWSPNDAQNPINNVVVARPPVIEVNATYRRDPVILGTGAGLRVGFMGYILRADVAWGIDSGVLQKRRFHISVGKDF